MGQLSGQGVKLVLPALLKGVEDKAWRTKQGSIQVSRAAASGGSEQWWWGAYTLERIAPVVFGRRATAGPAHASTDAARGQRLHPGRSRMPPPSPPPLRRVPLHPTPPHPPAQLLGAMAHCAPKQLGSCLPVVVPRLGDVLADPHPKVASAARTALNEVGSVIRNPEVAKLVPVLLAGG